STGAWSVELGDRAAWGTHEAVIEIFCVNVVSGDRSPDVVVVGLGARTAVVAVGGSRALACMRRVELGDLRIVGAARRFARARLQRGCQRGERNQPDRVGQESRLHVASRSLGMTSDH